MTTGVEHPVDLSHLARYTGGDRGLDSEILQLFVGQSLELLTQLPVALEAGDRKGWHHIAHSLKGAARGIGAFGFAEIAAEAEKLDPTNEPRAAETISGRLQTGLDEVRGFIEDFVGQIA